MRKQVYKLEFSKKWRIYDIFYILLLDQDNIKKRQVKKIQLELEASNSK